MRSEEPGRDIALMHIAESGLGKYSGGCKLKFFFYLHAFNKRAQLCLPFSSRTTIHRRCIAASINKGQVDDWKLCPLQSYIKVEWSLFSVEVVSNKINKKHTKLLFVIMLSSNLCHGQFFGQCYSRLLERDIFEQVNTGISIFKDIYPGSIIYQQWGSLLQNIKS